MRVERLSVAVASSLALIAGQPLRAAPLPAATQAKVAAIFANWDKPDAPGCALGVSQNGQGVLARAWGQADLERPAPNTPATIFEAGSVSKQFTAAAVLMLAREGKLSLDDPVQKHLPELPDYGAPVTLRHLLNHTSGLRDWGALATLAGWPRGTRVHTHAHVLEIAARQRSLNFPPGTQHSYSNTGYNLLVMVVERVSGRSFSDYTRATLFEPLGMAHSSWRDDYARVVRGRALAYAPGEGGFRLNMPFENVFGNGGLLTTVGDLLLWSENLAHARLGGPDFVKLETQRTRLQDGSEVPYAMGLYVARYKEQPEISHSGGTAGYRAFLVRYPERQTSIALLCNAADANPTQLAHDVADAVLGLGPRAAGPPPEARELQAVAGTYRDVRSGELLTFAVAGGSLRTDSGQALVPLGGPSFGFGSQSRISFETGAQAGMRFETPYEPEQRFARVVAASPTTAQLAELTGSYASGEADTVFDVVLEKDALLLVRRPGQRLALTPLDADAFAAPFGSVRFRRDARGSVVALAVTLPRVYDLRFDRVR